MINSSNNEHNQIVTVSLLIIAMICVSFAFYYTRSVLVPFVLALFIRFLISPIVDIQINKFRIHRIVAIPVAIIIVILFFIIFIPPLYNSLRDFLEGASDYQDKVIILVDFILNWVQKKFNLDIDIAKIEELLINLPFLEWSSELLSHTVHFVESVFIIFVIFLFLLIGEKNKEKTLTWNKIDISVKKYISTKFLIAFSTAILFGTTYWYLELELAIIFASLTFFLTFIPIFGAIIAVLLPIPVAFIQYDSLTPIMLVILIPSVVKVIIGDFIEPKLLGSTLDLNPVTIVMALIFWGMLWGIVGVFLAAPLTAIIKISFEQFEITKPFARILAGKIHHKINF